MKWLHPGYDGILRINGIQDTTTNSRTLEETRETKDRRMDEDPTEDPEEPEGPRESPRIETRADVEGFRPSLHRSQAEPKGEDLETCRGINGRTREQTDTNKCSR